MKKISARPADNLERIMNTYGNILFRPCLFTLGNSSDAEDAVQDTLIKYMQSAPNFNSDSHEKAWLIKVASNRCRDILRFHKRHPSINLEDISEFIPDNTDTRIMDALMILPEKYRIVLMLYYVEEFSVTEIAQIIEKTPSAVKMRLKKGRILLRDAYRKELM